MPNRYSPLVLWITTLLVLFATPARSEIVSDWAEGYGTRARLIAGATANGTQAGIQIVLDEGWKTYWRNPGAGGIPPAFDWSGSQNISSADVQFPAPHRYHDTYGTSMGYKHVVVFPITHQVINPGSPVILRLKIDYAVCEQLCVPVQANLLLDLPANISVGYSEELQLSQDQVPDVRSADDARVESLQIATSNEESWFEITARYPGQPTEHDLFVEGPASWFLPAPTPMGSTLEGQDTLVRYRVDLSGVPKSATIEGAQFLFTIVADNHAVEQQWIYD